MNTLILTIFTTLQIFTTFFLRFFALLDLDPKQSNKNKKKKTTNSFEKVTFGRKNKHQKTRLIHPIVHFSI
jgi:hypothetical protein